MSDAAACATGFALHDCSLAALRAYFETLGEPGYRALQWAQWVHQRGTCDPMQMTNFRLPLREHLAAQRVTMPLQVLREHIASDGTRKWLFALSDGQAIETVYIPEGRRGTLCVSSQVGCALQCSFCATGAQGFNRNLRLGEIMGQVWCAHDALRKAHPPGLHPITNVVFMGMGEPLLNLKAVLPALEWLLHDRAYGLSKYRVTVSTSGVVPQMHTLASSSPSALAVSLHAPCDSLRDVLVPLNKKYPLSEVMDACRHYVACHPRRHVLYEYVLLQGVNDTPALAKDVARLLARQPAKVNLIPFNPYPGAVYRCSDTATIHAFQHALHTRGIRTTIRRTRGDACAAACGQLQGQFDDKTRRRARRWVPVEVCG